MKNNLKSTLAIVILFAAIAIFIFTGAAGWLVNTLAGRTAAAATQEVDPAAAAELGVEAVFTVNHEGGIDAWQKNVCAVSTTEGCADIVDLFAEGITEGLSGNQADMSCSATALKQSSDNGIEQIWILEVTTSGWTEEPRTELLAVAVARDDESGEWKLSGIIFGVPQGAMVQMLTPTAQP